MDALKDQVRAAPLGGGSTDNLYRLLTGVGLIDMLVAVIGWQWQTSARRASTKHIPHISEVVSVSVNNRNPISCFWCYFLITFFCLRLLQVSINTNIFLSRYPHFQQIQLPASAHLL